MDAVLWLGAGAVLLVAEMFTLTVVLGLVGAGAVVAGLAALLGAPVVVQGGAFVLSSAGLLVFAREPARRALARGGSGATDALDARVLTGTTAVVTERVSEVTGQVRLNGELWRARPYAGGPPVEVGAAVSVAAVEGATVLVYPLELS